MTEETMYPKDGNHVKFKSVRLPVKTYWVQFAFQIKDEEAAKEAWRQLVKASGCSVINDPFLREEYDVSHDETITVIEGAVVEHPDIPGPRPLRNPNYLELRILEDSNDRYA